MPNSSVPFLVRLKKNRAKEKYLNSAVYSASTEQILFQNHSGKQGY